MRFVIARLNHETNSFSPVPTPLEAFEPQWGEAAAVAARGSRTPMGAFLDLASGLGARITTPLFAMANPSGPVEDVAYQQMADAIVKAVAEGCDAVLLDLHGAMVTTRSDDGEGELLERVRLEAPGVPVAVALDLHGNVTQRMIDHADIMVSFKTYPHVDMYETGAHAGRLLARMLAGEIRPVLAWRRPPLMTHTLRSATGQGAMQRAVQAARQAEREGLLGVSVFAGFALADTPAPCLSVVALADSDPAQAAACVEQIARKAWEERSGFVYQSEPLETSMRRARELAAGAGSGPVLLLDHGDNCMSGGTCDDMDVLRAALEHGLEDILVGPICDPQAVAQLLEMGHGAHAVVQAGNKRPLAKLGITKTPLVLEGTVRAISDGQFRITGPIYTGQTVAMGRTVLFDTGAARLVLTERTQEPLDIGVFACVGENARSARYLLLKSRMYCRPVFEPLAKGVVECDGRGVTSSDYSLFPFGRVQRPVYPLDPGTRWMQSK
ncbi:MAG: M81 family metallopeptidase [Betaproteobacteria bacterium]